MMSRKLFASLAVVAMMTAATGGSVFAKGSGQGGGSGSSLTGQVGGAAGIGAVGTGKGSVGSAQTKSGSGLTGSVGSVGSTVGLNGASSATGATSTKVTTNVSGAVGGVGGETVKAVWQNATAVLDIPSGVFKGAIKATIHGETGLSAGLVGKGHRVLAVCTIAVQSTPNATAAILLRQHALLPLTLTNQSISSAAGVYLVTENRLTPLSAHVSQGKAEVSLAANIRSWTVAVITAKLGLSLSAQTGASGSGSSGSSSGVVSGKSGEQGQGTQPANKKGALPGVGYAARFLGSVSGALHGSGVTTVSILAGSVGGGVTVTAASTSAVTKFIPSTEAIVSAFTVHFPGQGAPVGSGVVARNSHIGPASGLYRIVGHQLVPVTGTTRKGEAVIPVLQTSKEESFLIVSPRTAVPGATSPVTGVPVAFDLAEGIALTAVGGALMRAAKKRRLQ
ncbi:MAG: hypothetical protein ACYCYO_11595 [Bacilli bacterium]